MTAKRSAAGDFFKAFWPNLASTILGVILAIPPALWLANTGQRAQHKAEVERLTQALHIVSETLSFNRQQFNEVLTTLNSNQTPFELRADYSAWDAVKSEIIPFLHDSQLQRKLAYHFSRTQAVARLNELYLNYAVGIGAALAPPGEIPGATRDALRTYFLQTLSTLDAEAGELIEDIREAKP
jgi:hypothetical protein